MLFEEATDINFFVGCAANPAHYDPDLNISFDIKMRLIRDLADCLKQMGKTIRINYFLDPAAPRQKKAAAEILRCGLSSF